MKNKESILKKEIDIANLSVSIIPTIAFIVVFALAFSVSVLGEYYFDNGFDLVHDVRSLTADALILSYLDFDVLITLIGGALIALWNFSFLLNKNHARAVLLQPKKRSTLFNQKVTIPLIALVLIVIVIKIIALLVNIKYNTRLSVGYITPFIADTLVCLTTLFWGYMCGVAGTILPGRKLETVLGGVSLALLPNAIINIFNYSATAFLRGYIFDHYIKMSVLDFLDPIRVSGYSYVALPFKVPVSILIYSALWIVISVVCIVLLKVYFEKNYKFENCGMVNKNRFITFVTGVSMPVVLSSIITEYLFKILNPNATVINIMTTDRNNWYFERLTPEEPYILLAVFVCLAIILSLVFNIITTVKIGNLKEKVKPVIAIVGSTVVLSLVCLTGGLGYENRLPGVEDIETVAVQAPYDLVETNAELIGIADYYDINQAVLREGIKFDNAEDIEKVLAIHSLVLEDKNKETTEGINFTYKLKNGSVIERSYRYISKNNAEEILKLWNTNKVKELYKVLLLNEGRKENDSFNYSFWGKSRLSMEGFAYIQSKDAVLTSITDLLSEDEIKDLKKAIYKDITSLAYFEWFKPTESYGLLQFSSGELTKEPLPFVMSNQSSVAFQVTKEMTNTVEFLNAHDLMKFFEITREPVEVYLVDANELGECYKEHWRNVYGVTYIRSYPMQHRMMFAAETTVSSFLYTKDAEPIINILNEPWCQKLTTEEYKDYIEKSHIKYFSGDGGKLLVVAYPESNCAYSLAVVED